MNLKLKLMKKVIKKKNWKKNQRVLVNNYIKNIEDSEKETEDVKEEKLLKVYEAASVEIPEMDKKKFGRSFKISSGIAGNQKYQIA